MPRCDHKFIDSNYCAKCGVSVETLKAEQRTFFGVDVSADAPEPLKKFAQRTNAEQAVLDACEGALITGDPPNLTTASSRRVARAVLALREAK